MKLKCLDCKAEFEITKNPRYTKTNAEGVCCPICQWKCQEVV